MPPPAIHMVGDGDDDAGIEIVIKIPLSLEMIWFVPILELVKVSKSRKQSMISSILSKKMSEDHKIQSIFSTQDSKFCSFLGRIKEIII